MEVPQKVPGKASRKLDMWYYPGHSMNVQAAFMNVQLELNLTNSKFDHYDLYQVINNKLN